MVHFAATSLIGKYCEHIVSLFVCSFFYVFHGFSSLHLASPICLFFSLVFIVSSYPSFIFPCAIMMCSRPSISSRACHSPHSTIRF